MTGTSTTVLKGLFTSPTSGLAFFAVSSTGTLACLPGGQAEVERQLVSVDRQGVGTPIIDERGNFLSPSYSPDGTKVAVERFEGSGRRTIWVFDLVSGARIRLTTGGEHLFFYGFHPATLIREQRNQARIDGELTGLLSGVLPTSVYV